MLNHLKCRRCCWIRPSIVVIHSLLQYLEVLVTCCISGNYQNNHLENTALKCSSYLLSQVPGLVTRKVSGPSTRHATEENPAIASSSQHQQGCPNLLRHKAHIIWPRATAHPHTPWTADSWGRSRSGEDDSQNGRLTFTTLQAPAPWQEGPKLTAAGQHNLGAISARSSGLPGPHPEKQIIQQPPLPQALLRGYIWTVQSYKRFSNQQVCMCCKWAACPSGLIFFRAEGNGSRWHQPCVEDGSQKHLYVHSEEI